MAGTQACKGLQVGRYASCSLGYEFVNGFAQVDELTHHAAADACQLGAGEEEDGLHSGEMTVDVGHVTLVLEIGNVAYTADDGVGTYLGSIVHGESIVGRDADTWLVVVYAAYDVETVFELGKGVLTLVDTYSNDDMVGEGEGTPHNVGMTDGEGIESPRKDGFHLWVLILYDYGYVPAVSEVFFRLVLLDDEVVDDEVLPFHGVFAHIEIEQSHYGIVLLEIYTFEPYVLVDEVAELIGRDFAKTFETGYLHGWSLKTFNRRLPLFVAVAIEGDEVGLGVGVGIVLGLVALDGFFAVSHTEERGLENIDMPLLDEVGEELQEEGNHEQTDVHAIDIGISGHDNLVVAQSVEAVFDVKCRLQEVEFFVLIDNLLGETEGVERFATETEYSLGVDVAALGDATAGAVALGDEDAALLAQVAFGIVEVDAAVAQLAVVHVHLLGTLAGELGDACDGLALLFGILYLLQHGVGSLRCLVEEVVHLGLDEVAHELVETHAAVGRHGGGAEFHLSLALEDGFLDIDSNGRHHAVAYVSEFLVLVVELFDGTGYVFLEGALMGTSLCGVLAVDERVVLLAVLAGVGEGNLYVIALEMDDRVEGIGRHAVSKQVGKSVAGEDAPTIVHDSQTGVEVGIVAKHVFHDGCLEGVAREDGWVGLKPYLCAVLVGGVVGGIALQHATLESYRAHLAITEAGGGEVQAEGIDGLGTYAVEAYALLECFAVVLTPGIEHAHGFYELPLRNAAAIVAHADNTVVGDVNFDAFAGIHLEFIDAVVDDLLEQYIDAVIALRAVAQLSDVHAGSQPYMLHIAEVTYVFVGVCYLFGRCCSDTL